MWKASASFASGGYSYGVSGSELRPEEGGAPAVLEGFVRFLFEVSVIAVRGAGGETRFYDVPINTHRNGILHTSDGGVSWNIVEDATAMTGGKLKNVIFTKFYYFNVFIQ